MRWENMAPDTEFDRDFCAGIGPLQLGVVLVPSVFTFHRSVYRFQATVTYEHNCFIKGFLGYKRFFFVSWLKMKKKVSPGKLRSVHSYMALWNMLYITISCFHTNNEATLTATVNKQTASSTTATEKQKKCWVTIQTWYQSSLHFPDINFKTFSCSFHLFPRPY